jgi:putative ABC transport system permease protein
VLFVSLRDLQWRRRRFIIGVLAAGLVFAMTLLISGVSASFGHEIKQSVGAFDADAWIIPSDVSGPFTSARVFPAAEAQQIASRPGVRGVAPVLLMRSSVKTTGSAVHDINVVGIPAGGIIAPKLAEGHDLRQPGDIIVDKALHVKLGATLHFSGRDFTVVGRTSGLTYFAGIPIAWVGIGDLQSGALNGAPLATTVVVRGSVTSPPAGYRAVTNAGVRHDLARPMRKATATIAFINLLLWIVAAGIIGSLLYLQAIERSRDFAVFKATGVTTRTLLWGLGFQAIALALSAAIAAYILSVLLAPAMSMPVVIPASAYILLPVVAIIVGLVSSIIPLRRAVTVDPALAFG